MGNRKQPIPAAKYRVGGNDVAVLQTALADEHAEVVRLARGHDEYNRVNQLLMQENERLMTELELLAQRLRSHEECGCCKLDARDRNALKRTANLLAEIASPLLGGHPDPFELPRCHHDRVVLESGDCPLCNEEERRVLP